MSVTDERDDELEPASAREELDPADISQAITDQDSSWMPGGSIELGNLHWRPYLRREDKALLHIHLADRLRPYVRERFEAASTDGFEVHLAAPLISLYDEELLADVAVVDPLIHVIEEAGGGQPPKVGEPARLFACLADHGIQLTPSVRRDLGRIGLEISKREGTSHQKGRRFEALLAFLLSQVDDFVVVERNFNTATEEIDLVIQQRATAGRIWATLGAPLVLAEGKNRKEKISQEMFSVFRTKMQGRRGTVRIGLMFAASGVTESALLQELRFSSQELTVAFMGDDALSAWIEAEDGDAHLEEVITRAMLR